MIIEFAGASCTGKSTLIRRLERELREDGFEPRLVGGWNRRSRADMIRGLIDVRVAAWCLLNPRKVAARHHGRVLLAVIGMVKRLRSEDGLVLLDEGPVKLHQRGHLQQTRFTSVLVRAVPVPDVLVIVTCDPAARLKRLRQADRPFARTIPDEVFLSGADPTEAAARRFAAARNVPVIEIDTSPGADQSATLRQRLGRFLRGAGRRAPSVPAQG